MSPRNRAPRERPRGLTVPGSFGLALALLGVLVVVAAFFVQSMLERTTTVSNHLSDRIMPAHIEAARLESALLNQETGIRGYALTGDERFLEPYDSGQDLEQKATAELRRLLSDEPALMSDMEAVVQAANVWRQTYAEPLLARIHAGTEPSRGQDSAKGKAAFDAVRQAWIAQGAHLERARTEARADLEDSRMVRDAALLAAVFIIVLVGVMLALLIQLTVVRPLGKLRLASRRAAEGDFSSPIPCHGPADVREVGQTVEAMRARIVQELDAAKDREKLLVQQAIDLDSQAVELRRSNAELEQFAYVASHDLQEPLRKVASFCQMLERRYHDQLDDRGRQYIEFATDGAKRMQVLISDLLTFSRVGRMNSHRRVLGLDEALDRAVANLGGAIADAGAEIDRPAKLPELTGDPTLLSMLWQNLIGNALKFRRPDEAPCVRIECAEQGPGLWRCTVTDNGIGIPAEYAEKVFVIFQRLHTRDAYEGTGIGLALCKKIVEYHGGEIWLDTEYTDGSRVHFTLADSPVPAPALAPDDDRTETVKETTP
ncbi:phospho-acceptor domain-containing protein [Actinocorallia herbida]|uniref:histidine kinase n=1 Tax=Actinocorallia herbida TaxID=58109 RepID=A0A3N1CS14_9ACTN|nr:sensor histidine kinase [Actinocorallia herbida]ROO84087.1 phospho-acceptor domain-containing protein [Actinocorallia herbida]